MHERLAPEPIGQLANDDFLTAEELAALLRMTPGWVYSETRRDRIPHIRLGRYFRYRRSAIRDWMGELEVGSPPELRPRHSDSSTDGLPSARQ